MDGLLRTVELWASKVGRWYIRTNILILHVYEYSFSSAPEVACLFVSCVTMDGGGGDNVKSNKIINGLLKWLNSLCYIRWQCTEDDNVIIMWHQSHPHHFPPFTGSSVKRINHWAIYLLLLILLETNMHLSKNREPVPLWCNSDSDWYSPLESCAVRFEAKTSHIPTPS